MIKPNRLAIRFPKPSVFLIINNNTTTTAPTPQLTRTTAV